jgi:glycosyltransferase involved in cell wall biosynthesis
VERAYLRSVDAFVFTSHSARAAVEARVGACRGLVVHPAGNRLGPVPSEREIYERAHEPGPLRIIFVGNIIARKGLDVLLGALSRAPRGSWTLTVVGDPSLEPETVREARRVVATRGLLDHVRFTGRLPDQALAKALRGHHILAVPSRYEGFGIVYLEGMTFGLPCIAAAAGGAPELVEHGVSGYLAPPGDVDAVARAVLRLSSDRALLARMGIAARRRARMHPTWEQTMGRARTFLLEIVQARGAATAAGTRPNGQPSPIEVAM